MSTAVPFTQLLQGIPGRMLQGSPQVLISGVSCDSREVEPGHVFVAIDGADHDGHLFAPQAISRGAVALVVKRPLSAPVAQFFTEHPREALAKLAAAFYGRPARSLKVIGVTGTNGKTTVTYLLESIARAAGRSAGVIGTTGARWGEITKPLLHTTPEAPMLQGLLREMLDRGVELCAMEVSSHALDLERVRAIDFTQAVFTNLTRDHLDYHGDLKNYARAKALLFQRELNTSQANEKCAVFNADDPWAEEIVGGFSGEKISFGLGKVAHVHPLEEPRLSLNGFACRICFPGGEIELASQLIGRHNLLNALAAFACALKLGISPQVAAAGVMACRSVPGRLERVEHPGDAPLVLVDYAHTDDALENVLSALRPLVKGKLMVVFGCGGDRDRGKRPLMGAVVSRWADMAWVTSDNPRSEDPLAIIADILPGLAKGRLRRSEPQAVAAGCFAVVPDRRQAIEQAIRLAADRDLVLIAGKGHEDYQIIGKQRFHFDDRQEARRALAAREGKRDS